MTPKKIFFRLFFAAVFSLLFLPFHSAFAAAFITLDNFSGPPTTVNVSGGGWAWGENVSFFINAIAGEPVTTVTTGGDGFFGPLAVPIPVNTPQGPIQIIASGATNNEQPSNTYYIVPFRPSISVTGNNTPGSRLTIDGAGFAPNEVVRFILNGNTIGQAATDATGSFLAASATVPTVPTGTYQLHGIGQSSNADAVQYFYVGEFFPSVMPSSYYLLPTQALNFSGTGYSPGETIEIFVGQNQTPIATITANDQGAFTDAGNIVIPLSFMGNQLFRLHSLVSDRTTQIEVTVGQFNPYASPSTYYILPGNTIMFSGGGFAANERVKIYADAREVGEFTTDSFGTFTDLGGVLIPFEWLGSSRTLRLVGQTGGGVTDVTFTVGQFNSLVSPSTYFITAGQSLTFSGSDFAPGETITITEGDDPTIVATFAAGPTGTFTESGTVTIPFSWANSSRTFHIMGQSSGTRADAIITVAEFSPYASPSTYYLFPGNRISFSGSGFGMNETIAVTANQDTTSLATITADTTGSFTESGSFTIPFAWRGDQTLHLTGQSSQATAAIDITVASFSPSLTPSTYYVIPGQSLLLSGNGFAPDERVDLIMANGPTVTVLATSTGAWLDAGPFIAPLRGSTLHFTASGQSSNATTSIDITLGNLYPSVVPDLWYVMSGNTVTFSGTGFGANEMITLTSNGATLGTVSTDAAGSLSNLAITTGFGEDRAVTYTFTGSESDAVAEVTITVAALSAYVELDTYYAQPGTAVLVTGAGFAPNESVTISMGSATATGSTDARGNLSATAIAIPLGLPGPTAGIIVTGNTSNVAASTELTLAPFPLDVTPSTWYTAPGTTVTFSGTGFSPNENVNVSLGGSTIAPITANATGGFLSSITIPVTATTGNFVFTGAESNASITMSITLAGFAPQVTPSTWYTGPGSNVTFSGIDFAAGETVTITLNNAPAGSITVDAAGGFMTDAIVMPFGATSAAITFTGSISNAVVMIPITLAPLNPGIQLSTYYAPGGTPLTITGMGFGSNEIVNITVGGQLYASPTTDGNGDFTLTSAVPYQPSGDKTIQATGASSGVSAGAMLTMPPVYVSAQLGAYAGAPGTAVTFIGNGYIPGETISITSDRTGETILHSFTVDAGGTFTNAGFAIPAGFTEGPITFTISGGYSFSPISIIYYVTG